MQLLLNNPPCHSGMDSGTRPSELITHIRYLKLEISTSLSSMLDERFGRGAFSDLRAGRGHLRLALAVLDLFPAL